VSVKPDADLITAYSAAGVPIILFDEEAAGVSAIAADNHLGGRITGEYLISKGRKKSLLLPAEQK